jgi:hypothetical protein
MDAVRYFALHEAAGFNIFFVRLLLYQPNNRREQFDTPRYRDH